MKKTRKTKTEYGIYDLTDNERLIGIFTAKEAAEYIGLTLGSFYSTVTRKNKNRGKFYVVRVEEGQIN